MEISQTLAPTLNLHRMFEMDVCRHGCLADPLHMMRFPFNPLLSLVIYHSQHIPGHLRTSWFLLLKVRICEHTWCRHISQSPRIVSCQFVVRDIRQFLNCNLQRTKKPKGKPSLSFCSHLCHKSRENIKFSVSNEGRLIRALLQVFPPYFLPCGFLTCPMYPSLSNLLTTHLNRGLWLASRIVLSKVVSDKM